MNFPPPQKCDYIVKVSVFGAKQSGKTSILSRLCYNDFTSIYRQTNGFDFFLKNFTLAQKKIKLQFWDIEVTKKSQGEKIRQLACKGVIALIFVYSITDSSSFQFIQSLLSIQKSSSSTTPIPKQYTTDPTLPKFLIANKKDLQSQGKGKIDKENGQKLARQNGLIYMQTSAKDQSGIRQLSTRIGTEILSVIRKQQLGK